jgi:gluconolactonase
MTFSGDILPSTIWQLTPPSTVREFLPGSGTNGLAVRPDGGLVGAAHDVQGLVLIDAATGAKTVWVDSYQGDSFNSPNDLAVRSDGTVYFSDPRHQLGSRTSETGMTGVYRVTPQGEVSVVDATMNNPNGVALSPDASTLYVGEENGQIWSFSIASDGTTSDRQAFASVPTPDGMGVDCAGNLYVAAHNEGVVHVLSSVGTELGTLRVAPSATNVAFGGADHQTLYISAGRRLFSLPMNLPGFPN